MRNAGPSSPVQVDMMFLGDPPRETPANPTICVECKHVRQPLEHPAPCGLRCAAKTELKRYASIDYVSGESMAEVRWPALCALVNDGQCQDYEPREAEHIPPAEVVIDDPYRSTVYGPPPSSPPVEVGDSERDNGADFALSTIAACAIVAAIVVLAVLLQ